MEAGRFPPRAVKRVNRCQQSLNRYYWWVNGMNFFFSNEARANTRNISLKNSLRCSIYIINSVYETQLSCYDPLPPSPPRRSTIISKRVNVYIILGSQHDLRLSNSVIRCFGELILIYTFIITDHLLSTTLRGGGGWESGQGFMSCHNKIRLLPQRLYSNPMILPSLVGSQFSIVPPLYSGSDDDWLPFRPPWKSCNTPKFLWPLPPGEQ